MAASGTQKPDQILESHKFSPEGSIWAPETLQQVRDRLERIDEYPCHCGTSEHVDALHDLANDDVRVLLKVIEGQAAEIDRLRRGAKTLGEIVENQCRMTLDASGLHHLIGEDGDGDWGLVWERLAELADEVERLREVRRIIADDDDRGAMPAFLTLGKIREALGADHE
ncbi:hypothetical protein [Mycolicibacterium goodii]|uniref:hypothetical protein n=1 Tax=Mycolicibacterium goodii TaxID=134601 RepID=UPI001BDCE4B4|nr:hypothetical protein [Mycolicibacterium goodii]MBU8830862.1 hypothetical protein [Mycolicibacterium goodii]